jgi:hypothetical protein
MKMKEQLKFQITGSQGDIYTIFASKTDNNMTILCNCTAGINGQYCKHRLSLLDGDITNLSSDNSDDVQLLKEMFLGTDVERNLILVKALEIQYEDLKKKLSNSKKALARSMND